VRLLLGTRVSLTHTIPNAHTIPNTYTILNIHKQATPLAITPRNILAARLV